MTTIETLIVVTFGLVVLIVTVTQIGEIAHLRMQLKDLKSHLDFVLSKAFYQGDMVNGLSRLLYLQSKYGSLDGMEVRFFAHYTRINGKTIEAGTIGTIRVATSGYIIKVDDITLLSDAFALVELMIEAEQ